MKKSDLIRIEIKETREEGLLLYSYKKKKMFLLHSLL